MFLCLTVGSVLIAAVLACIPMYTMGTLRQMLSTDMQEYERENLKPAGQLYFTGKIPGSVFGTSRGKKVTEAESILCDGLKDTVVTIKNSYTQVVSANMKSETGVDGFDYSASWSLNAIEGIDDNIEIIEGKIYSAEVKDDIIEVIVEENEWKENEKAKLGEVYVFTASGIDVKVRPVGVFKVKNPESEYWYDNSSLFKEALFCNRSAYESRFFGSKDGEAISNVNIYLNLDFSHASIENLSDFAKYYKKINNYSKNLGIGRGRVTLNCVSLINEYIAKTTDMQMSLWVLNVPVIAMLAFYMIMVTKMIIAEDRNEISTFKSRGAKTGQIFLRYVIECGIISVFALILGPLLGLFLAKTVGNASGFLEFNAREKMPVRLDGMAYVYALAACVFFSALILLPALAATKKTIVNLKQRGARKSRMPWWEKCFLDFIILGVSIGLFFIYKRTGGFNVDGTVDPLVYIISSLFILGAGMVALRIYPYVVALIFSITKRILRPAPYSAFVQVSRGGDEYKFLMLFLIMTISVGIYSSASARIINNNVEETVKYETGADAVIAPDFDNPEIAPYKYNDDGTKIKVPESFRHFSIDSLNTDYPFIKSASRVAHCGGNYVEDLERGYYRGGINVMAIDPFEYGSIGWCSKALNGISLNQYLNILEVSPTSVIISRALSEDVHANVGDEITVEINGSNYYDGENWPTIKCRVAAIVEYWPTMMPGETVYFDWNEDGIEESWVEENKFIIMNFEYLYSVRDTQVFDLYLALNDDAKTGVREFSDMCVSRGLIASQEQIKTYTPDIMEQKKSDSMLRGLNGSYSIGFVSTLLVSFAGFLIYWIMNIRKRRLQFGILRAMGLTKSSLTGMLVFEHILTTGVSVVLGIIIGAITVKIYTPLLAIAHKEGVIPLRTAFNRADNMKIYVVVAAMLVVGIIVLATFINRLKINEAVKIGEE